MIAELIIFKLKYCDKETLKEIGNYMLDLSKLVFGY